MSGKVVVRPLSSFIQSEEAHGAPFEGAVTMALLSGPLELRSGGCDVVWEAVEAGAMAGDGHQVEGLSGPFTQ